MALLGSALTAEEVGLCVLSTQKPLYCLACRSFQDLWGSIPGNAVMLGTLQYLCCFQKQNRTQLEPLWDADVIDDGSTAPGFSF